MRMSGLGAVALGITGAAVGGFGASIGRDAWGKSKKSGGSLFFLALAACAIVLPFLGARNMARATPYDKEGSFWSGPFLLLLGFGVPYLFLYFAANENVGLVNAKFALTFNAIGAIPGALWGGLQRPKRMAQFEIAERNEEFLAQRGFVETGESEVSHTDGDGQALRLMERTDDTIVFMAVGRRNRRAYIRLSPEGEMLGYTGVIGLDEPREYF